MSGVTEEIAAWKATVAASKKRLQVIAATSAFVSFKYERTAYVQAKVKLTFPADYPTNHLIVSIEGGLAPGLNKKLVREMEEVAKKQQSSSSNNADTPHQIEPVVDYFTEFLDTNRFVSCWKEVRKLVEMAKQSPSPTTLAILALQETQGMIRLKMTHDAYVYDCKLVVNPGYPSTSNLEDPLQLTLVKSNFPKQIVQDVIAMQAKGFVRYLQDGVPSDEAWVQSNPIQLPQSNASCIDTTTGDPIPSLLPLVSMLRSKLMQLPSTHCPGCQTVVLPNKPSQLATIYDTKSKKQQQQQQQQRPMYSCCGCWFHYKCLNTLIVEPPFGLKCPTCGKRAHHSDWSADTKELERAYAERQARQREMDDVAMMF